MEKYTKFDDKRTGTNPFIPLPTQNRNFIIQILAFVIRIGELIQYID